MKNTLKVLISLTLLLSLFSIKDLSAQWVKQSGPWGGTIEDVVVSAQGNLFAGTFVSGIYKSSNNGISWTAANNGLTSSGTAILELFVSGSDLYAATQDGVFRSTNEGVVWTELTGIPTYVTTVSVNGQVILAGTGSGGIYRSTNGGTTWAQSNTGLTNHNITSLFYNNSVALAGTWTGIYRSTDNGSSWALVFTGTNISSIVGSAIAIFASTNTFNGNVYWSVDGGSNWSNFGTLNNYVYDVAILNTKVYAATYEGVFHTSNLGANWNPINIGLNHKYVNTLCISGDNIYAGTNSAGVFVSTNSGAIWTESNQGLNCQLVTGFASTHVSDVWKIYASSYNGGLSVSNNEGASWQSLNSTLPTYSINDVMIKNNNLYIGTAQGPYVSTNNGLSWTQIYNGFPFPGISINSLENVGNDIYAGTSNGIFLTTDNGVNWRDVNNNILSNSIYDIVSLGSDVFIAGPSGVYKSSNSGANWTTLNVNYSFPYCFAVIGSNIYLSSGGLGIYKSTNSGANWSAVNSGLPSMYIYSLASSSGNLLAGTGSGFAFSTNGGASWTNENLGLISQKQNVGEIAVMNNNIYAGVRYYSVWKRPFSQITGVQTLTGELPAAYSLSQNFPNPFNPTTRIDFSLPVNASLSLIIYDITGREVTRLINNEFKSAGNHSLQFNAGNLAGGVYFYRLTSNDFVQTKKLILVK